MLGIGPTEMLIVGVIALLLFGKKLPEVARNLGKGLVEFKRGMAGIEEEIHTSVNRPVPSQSRPAPVEEPDEIAAPKFEPPKYEPAETSPVESSAAK